MADLNWFGWSLAVLIGIATGTAIAAIVLRLRYGNTIDALKEDIRHITAREGQLQFELSHAHKQLEELRSQEMQLRRELTETGLNNTRLQTLLNEAKKQYDEQQTQFEAIGQRTLKLLKDELEEKATREAREKQQLLDQKMVDLLKPLRELIEQNDLRVREIEKQHTKDTASLKTHIELIVTETGKLVNVKNKLAEALSNSKGRGDWGEMELIRLLENSGLMEGIHYEAQKTTDGLRPDITIRLSNQRILYVDAKTILVNLERLVNADSEEVEADERRKHAAALEKEVLSLSVKSYESRCADSIDFVVLYVPRESMLRAALEEKPALMEQAFQRRVILASPLVLMSILKTVSYGWDQAQLSQKANEIHALGRDLHKRAGTFLERFVKVGERIEQLGLQYEESRISLSGRQGLIPQLKKFEDYGCKSEKTLPLENFETDTIDADIDNGNDGNGKGKSNDPQLLLKPQAANNPML